MTLRHDSDENKVAITRCGGHKQMVYQLVNGTSAAQKEWAAGVHARERTRMHLHARARTHACAHALALMHVHPRARPVHAHPHLHARNATNGCGHAPFLSQDHAASCAWVGVVRCARMPAHS